MAADEIEALTGLTGPEAVLAKRREYDEPFLLANPASLPAVEEFAAAVGLRITRGGRFFHLTGDNDKGKAVRRLREVFENAGARSLKTVGVGDSPNDLPLLENVDYPVLVQQPGCRYDPSIKMSRLIRAPGEGPEGWSAAILGLLARLAP